MGRPTKYDPDFCETVIALGQEGASKAEMAHALGVSRPTMDAWAAQRPEFLYAIKEALEFSQGWWESQGRKATFGAMPGFNATSYIFQMKNRFAADWKDKVEQEHSGELNHKVDLDAERFTRAVIGLATRGTADGGTQ